MKNLLIATILITMYLQTQAQAALSQHDQQHDQPRQSTLGKRKRAADDEVNGNIGFIHQQKKLCSFAMNPWLQELDAAYDQAHSSIMVRIGHYIPHWLRRNHLTQDKINKIITWHMKQLLEHERLTWLRRYYAWASDNDNSSLMLSLLEMYPELAPRLSKFLE